MKTSLILLYAAAASIVVSIPMTLASTVFAGGTGSWSEVVTHPGFWVFFGRGVLWMSLTGFLASVLTLIFVTNRAFRGP